MDSERSFNIDAEVIKREGVLLFRFPFPRFLFHKIFVVLPGLVTFTVNFQGGK